MGARCSAGQFHITSGDYLETFLYLKFGISGPPGRHHRFITPSSVDLQIGYCAGELLVRALGSFSEMEDAVDLVRGRVGLDVVCSDD